MSSENLEEEGLPKNPNLQLAQWKFMLTTDKHKHDSELKQKLHDAIMQDNMAPFYEEVCTDLKWKKDKSLLKDMKSVNEDQIKQLDAEVADAEKAMGETEVRDAMLKKAEYLCRIGDKEGALTQFRLTQVKIVTLGYRLDIVFHLIRIGLFYNDHDLITRNIEKAQSLIEEGGDWDRRNRLKVYRGLYLMSVRDFKQAARLFLDTVATFTSYELMDYPTFVTYTVLCGVISLERIQLREEVIKGAEIQEVLHSEHIVKDFLVSLYECQYGTFFLRLADIEDRLKEDRYFHQHARFFVRELRIIAYSQLLESYRSLTLQYMADSFGVTVDFIDKELSRFIAAGRLHCKIDRVGDIVETNRPDSKNHQYQSVIKSGDILLNRIQKLSRVINI